MSQILDKLLEILQGKLPDTKSEWISDLRTEATHIPSGIARMKFCLLYTSPSPRDLSTSRMPSSA